MSKYSYKCPECEGTGCILDSNGEDVCCGECAGWQRKLTEEGEAIADLITFLSADDMKEIDRLNRLVSELRVRVSELERKVKS